MYTLNLYNITCQNDSIKKIPPLTPTFFGGEEEGWWMRMSSSVIWTNFDLSNMAK